MNNGISGHFYLFKGDWYERFIELLDLVDPQQKFTIWEPLNRHKAYNLVIISGAALPGEYCFAHNFWKTDEKTFEDFYKDKINRFNIHSNYNPGTEEPPHTENEVSYH